MSGYVDTREGWRELDVVTPDSIYQLVEYDPANGAVVRAWVREAPVPPLPTATWTIIRAMFREDELPDVFVCLGDSRWHNTGYTQHYDPEDLRSRIASFEVLVEPRAVTAKAVLEEARAFLDQAWQPGYERVLSYDLQAALFAHIREWAEAGE